MKFKDLNQCALFIIYSQKTAREGAKSVKVGRNRPAQNRHVRKNPQEKEEKHLGKSNPIICADFSETYLDECFILRHNEYVFIFLWKSRGMPGLGDHIPALVLKCWMGSLLVQSVYLNSTAKYQQQQSLHLLHAFT